MDRWPGLGGFCGTSSFVPNQGCWNRAEGTLLLARKAEGLRSRGSALPISPLVHRSETSSGQRVDSHRPAKLPNGLVTTRPPCWGAAASALTPKYHSEPLSPGRAGLPFRLLSPSRNFRYFSVFICCFQLEGAATVAQRVKEPAKPPSPATACPAVNPRHPGGLPFAPSLPPSLQSLPPGAGRPSASLFEEMGLKSLIGHQPTLPLRPSLFPTHSSLGWPHL